jgi:phage recombination protein Bet
MSSPQIPAVAPRAAAELQAPRYGFDPQDVALIKDQIARGLTDRELDYFLAFCRDHGLNPFLRQAYAIVRGSGANRTMAIQVGIDGYRLQAARTGLHAGTSDVLYGRTVTSRYRDANGKQIEVPETARIIVRKLVAGRVIDFPAEIRFDEFCQTKPVYEHGEPTGEKRLNAMWSEKPYHMSGKCSEALGIRKAFPAECALLGVTKVVDGVGQVEIGFDPEAGERGGDQAGAPAALDAGPAEASRRIVETAAPMQAEAAAAAATPQAQQAAQHREIRQSVRQQFREQESPEGRARTREEIEKNEERGKLFADYKAYYGEDLPPETAEQRDALRAERIRRMGELIGRPIGSWLDLTLEEIREARARIARLQQDKAEAVPITEAEAAGQ